ncbi:MAG: hypothetical protein H9901_03670 [Candidatus Paralactobacillus gallistercoris]|uniref:YtxH domain-containing protein n=1 Tax=Candidatus Paralactobacillus gallistercoris TaxID=2838724 RepID=A0A948X1B5_9LACO|nr:hypothetical protein [Candidatus Paralactobacillus gallistercoris]
MAGFWKGWGVGSLTGIVYGLLTTKHTGAENQQRLADYFKQLTQATNEVTTNVIAVKNALHTLTNEVKKASTTTVVDLEDLLRAFTFIMEPRVKEVKASVVNLQNDINKKD